MQTFVFIVGIGVTIACVSQAKQLGRSQVGWGVFGFLLPIVAIIWIQFMKPIGPLTNNNPEILNNSNPGNN